MLGEAARLALAERPARLGTMHARAERLIEGLLTVADVRLNGPRTDRLPGNVHISAGWVDGESLALALAADGVCVSPGSACTAAAGKAAPILEALGIDERWTRSGLLLSTGPATSADEVEHAVRAFAACVGHLRALSPVAADR